MSQERRRVLLVDARGLDARVVSSMLESYGNVEVVVEATLAAARRRLLGERFDLLIVDLTLPDSAGLSTFVELRDASSGTPTVVLTSMAEELTALRAVGAGARDYVLKRDVDIRTLDRALRSAVGRPEGAGPVPLPEQPEAEGGDTRLRHVLDNVLAFIGVFSLDGVVLDVNRAPLEASGLARGDVIGRRFVDMPWWSHSETERARIKDALARAARGERSRFDTHVRRMRGDIMHVDASFAPLFDEAGRIVQIVGSSVEITGRKRAEEALAHSQARLLEAQRVAHVGSWEWEVASNTVTWSDELCRIYGVDRGSAAGTYEGFLSRLHPDDRGHTIDVITQALRAGSPFVYEHRIVRSDGTLRMLHTRGAVIMDGAGKAERMVGSCWDVTERWEATQALDASVAALTATLEATDDGILVMSRDGQVMAYNERLLALWNLPPDLMTRKVPEILVHVREQVADPDALEARTEKLEADPNAEAFDVVHLKDGRVLERFSRPQRIAGASRGRVLSFRDVTQREQLLRATEQAREQAERARREMLSILERVSDGFVALDRDWRYRYVNDCGARMLGRTPAQLIGKHIWTEFPEGVGQRFQRAYERAVAEQTRVEIKEYYPPLQRWFENRIYPSQDGVSIFFSDITEQKQAEDRLRSSREQLRALGARLEAIREEERRMMAREIHDQIGQALTSLKFELAWVHAHLATAPPGETQRRLGAMAALVDDTLESARRLSSELRPAILDDLGLAAAIEWRAHDVESRTGIRCELCLPSDEAVRRLDRPRALALYRILQEALTNVVRHAGAQRVEIRLTLDGPEAVLIVRDDGRGARAGDLDSPAALGILGMKERALVFGGKVSVDGEVGAGTTVTVRLPFLQQTGPMLEAAQ